MDENAQLLIEKFKEISNNGYIKNNSKSFGSIGLTFEKELGKNPDSMYFPDYRNIEIKCTSRYSKYPLYLFTVAFDGPTIPEINRIVSKYGWYDLDYKDKLVLFAKLGFKNSKLINNKYKFKLSFDKNKDKIYLNVYDINDKLIERKSYIYVNSIYNHINLKLNKLAIIYASIKREKNANYFRYYKMNIYKLISFSKFLALLENDIVGVDLIARINKSGIDAGRYRNKNLVFYINKNKINELFKIIYSYNNDTGEENVYI